MSVSLLTLNGTLPGFCHKNLVALTGKNKPITFRCGVQRKKGWGKTEKQDRERGRKGGKNPGGKG